MHSALIFEISGFCLSYSNLMHVLVQKPRKVSTHFSGFCSFLQCGTGSLAQNRRHLKILSSSVSVFLKIFGRQKTCPMPTSKIKKYNMTLSLVLVFFKIRKVSGETSKYLYRWLSTSVVLVYNIDWYWVSLVRYILSQFLANLWFKCVEYYNSHAIYINIS